MKIVTNISNKIVGIGTKLCLPDTPEYIQDHLVDTNAIKTLVEMRILKIEDVPEKAVDVTEKAFDVTETIKNVGFDGTEGLTALKKEQIVAICEKMGIEISEKDTKATLIEKITVASQAD